LTIKPRHKVLHFDFMLYGWLLDENGHGCKSLANLSYPVVLLQGRKTGSDRFIERLRSDLYRVLNFSKVFHRNCARSENHTPERSIFAVYSPRRTAVWLEKVILDFRRHATGSGGKWQQSRGNSHSDSPNSARRRLLLHSFTLLLELLLNLSTSDSASASVSSTLLF
jgi:hypothetical protein